MQKILPRFPIGSLKNLRKVDANMAKSSNNLVNPNSREAIDKFKMEAAR